MEFTEQSIESNPIFIESSAFADSITRKIWQKPELSNLELDNTQGGATATWEDSSGIMS